MITFADRKNRLPTSPDRVYLSGCTGGLQSFIAPVFFAPLLWFGPIVIHFKPTGVIRDSRLVIYNLPFFVENLLPRGPLRDAVDTTSQSTTSRCVLTAESPLSWVSPFVAPSARLSGPKRKKSVFDTASLLVIQQSGLWSQHLTFDVRRTVVWV
jgi:hypothetical protein